MRLILLILFFLFLYWMIRRILIPGILAFLAIRKQQKHFHRHYRQQQRQSAPNKDGKVRMNNDKDKNKTRFPKDEGEYIDYKEVK